LFGSQKNIGRYILFDVGKGTSLEGAMLGWSL
jgi:hypothetical protein